MKVIFEIKFGFIFASTHPDWIRDVAKKWSLSHVEILPVCFKML